MQFTWELIQYARYHTVVSSPRRTAPSPIRSSGREAASRAERAMTGIPITMNSTRLTTKKALILLNTFCDSTLCTLLSISCILPGTYTFTYSTMLVVAAVPALIWSAAPHRLAARGPSALGDELE